MYLQFDVHANDNPVKYDDLSKYSLLFSNKQLESEIEASRSLIQSDTARQRVCARKGLSLSVSRLFSCFDSQETYINHSYLKTTHS